MIKTEVFVGGRRYSRGPVSVQVVCCPKSTFEKHEEYAKLVLEESLQVSDPEEIRARVFEDLGLSERKYVVQLHIGNNCKLAVLPRHLDRNTTYQIHADTGERVIYAHVRKKSSAKRDAAKSSLSEQDDVDPDQSFQTGAGDADEVGEGATGDSHPPTKSTMSKSSSLAQARKSKPEAKGSLQSRPLPSDAPADEPYELYRIGTGGKEKIKKSRVPYQIWLVAHIPKETPGRDREVTFWAVRTWRVAGVQVGRFAEGDEFDFDSMPDSYTLDRVFQELKDKGSISEYLFDIVDDYTGDFELVNRLSKDSKGIKEICRGPLITEYANKHEAPDIISKEGRKALIPAAVYFKNEISNQDLDIDDDWQVSLEHDDNCASLTKLLLEGDPKDENDNGLNGNKVLSKILGGFSLELWVLPNGSEKMYCWTTLDDEWRACDWLHGELVKKHDRSLYIEAHILPPKQKLSKKKLKSSGDLQLPKGPDYAGRLVNAVKEVDDDEVVAAPNEKASTKKRRTVIEEDEDIVDDEDEPGALRPALRRGRKPSKKSRR